jgi:hypothetical protein
MKRKEREKKKYTTPMGSGCHPLGQEIYGYVQVEGC